MTTWTVYDAWQVRAEDYPAGATPRERLRFALRYAILAPSGHNTQPWLFQLGDDMVTLRADRSRGLAVVDPDDRELVISCGAALYGLWVALAAFGEVAAVRLAPEPDDPDALAGVRLTGAPGPADPSARRLLAAMPRRRTNRMPFDATPPPGEVLARLVEAVAADDVTMILVPREATTAVADLVAEGDRQQMSDKAFRRELANWVHPNRSDAADGMRGYSFGMGDIMSAAGPLVIRTFDTGARQAAKDRELAAGSPVLAVLATEVDSPAAWLAAGQALFHALLEATDAGVSASFLNQPIEVAALRPRLAEAIGTRLRPQLLLRLGYGPDIRPSPRRPLEDVILPA